MSYPAVKRHGGNLRHIGEWKMPIWKGSALCESNFTTFWKRQNYEDRKKMGSCQGMRKGRMN
jgi:hypothetical protein